MPSWLWKCFLWCLSRQGWEPLLSQVVWFIVLAPEVTDVSARLMAIMNMHSKRWSCSKQLKVKMLARL